MSRILLWIIVFCFFTRLANAQPPAPASTGDYVEGEVIVIFKSSVDLGSARRVLAGHALSLDKHFRWLSEKRGQHMGLVRGNGQTTAALLKQLRNEPSVETVEPNYLRRALGGQTVNDPLFPQMWGLQNTGQAVQGMTGIEGDDIRFSAAWGLARASTNPPVVAVVDSGVYYTHPDLASNLWVNPGEIAGNGVDDDGNGYVDDVHGYNFYANNGDPSDSGLHGTHVSGTVAACGNNGVGVVGVNWRARIMALCVSGDGSSFSDAAIVEAIQYAAMMKSRGVNVVAINASYGGSSASTAESAAIQSAGDVGIIFCAAAGNDTNNNDTTVFYPAGYRLSNMLVVAASDQNDALANFSNYGATTVDLAAPGVNIVSTTPPGISSQVEIGSQVYQADALTYAGTTPGLTAALYDCGLGFPSNFTSQVRGNIALISRGTLYFSEKVANAMAAGAVGAIIYNNAAGLFSGTLQYASNWIPAVSISQADGRALLSSLPARATIFSARDPLNIYAYLSGTSMAAPHVAGAVAFAAMNFPDESVAQRRQRILAAVDPVPALSGKVRTGGRLNLLRVVDADGNGLPDWWEQANFGVLTGTDPTADPDGDGFNNLQEYWADTNPRDKSSCLRFTSIRPDNGRLRVEWSGGTQARQYLQRTATPEVPGSWTDILTNQPPTALSGFFVDPASAANGASYYRLRVEGQ